jgi:hypothetical protein
MTWRWAALAFLAACATTTAARPPVPMPQAEPPPDVARLVGWTDGEARMLASAQWTPADGAARVDAVVLERRVDERKELVLALVRAGRLVGSVPLARIAAPPTRPRSVGASLADLPLGPGDRALRVDVRTFDGPMFAVKTTLVAVVGDRTVRLLDRLVESGDQVRDRRADLSVRVDGAGAAELVVTERESGRAPPRTLVYRRGPDGRFVTSDRSIFDD